MYVDPNFKTKKALKEAIKSGQRVGVFQPNNIFGSATPSDGKVYLEGPHYPLPHSWYAEGTMKEGRLVSIK